MTGRVFTRGPALRLSAGLAAFACILQLEMKGGAQQPVFRSGVELIAVDVQVIDGGGNPIGQIGPEAFEVSINGKKRKVASAQFIRHTEVTSALKTNPVVLKSGDLDKLTAAAARTVIVAVDNGSFEPGDTQAAMEAARSFVQHVDPEDMVGLFVFPQKVWIEPSTERAPIGVRLTNIVGEKQPIRSYYNLKPHEIVDITAQSTNPNSFLTAVRQTGAAANAQQEAARALDPVLQIQARECPGETDCPIRIYSEGMTLAAVLEREAQRSLVGLETLLRILADMPGRKSVVFITGGLLVSDRLDGRPDPGNIARVMGQAAARANATVYTIHVDPGFANSMPASKRGNGSSDLIRDRAMLGNWLEDFSRSAGGKRIDVPVGGGEFAFNQVLRETSAYYLLGVEPADADRDGQPRELKVKVDRRGVTVRNRQWVLIPPKKNTH